MILFFIRACPELDPGMTLTNVSGISNISNISNVYTFSVTRYSKYFPNINLVWASIPGKALKKNPEIGIKINSKGTRKARKRETYFGLLGRCLALTQIIMPKNNIEKVRITEEKRGRVWPITVLAN